MRTQKECSSCVAQAGWLDEGCEEKAADVACLHAMLTERRSESRRSGNAIIQAEFVPTHGFHSPESKMGACFLGKGEALGTLLYAMAECGTYTARTAKSRNDCTSSAADDWIRDLRKVRVLVFDRIAKPCQCMNFPLDTNMSRATCHTLQ